MGLNKITYQDLVTVIAALNLNDIQDAIIALEGILPSIAPEYSVNTSYTTGDYVVYQNVLYKCTSSTSGAWNPLKWTAVNFADELEAFKADVNSELDDFLNKIYDSYVYDETSGTVVSVADGADNIPIKQMDVGIEPVQDLHGYDNPWVGGAGKNLLPIQVSTVKTNNSSYTWNGNTVTINNVAITLYENDDGYLTGIKANGTASAEITLFLIGRGWNYGLSYKNLLKKNETYKIESFNEAIYQNGRIAAGVYTSNGTNILGYEWTTHTNQQEAIIPNTDDLGYIVYLRINNGKTVSNDWFYPSIHLSSVIMTSFAPYSNICPITGHTACTVTRAGKNLISANWESGMLDVYNGTSISSNPYWCCNPDYVKASGNIAVSAKQTLNFVIYKYDQYKNFLGIIQPIRNVNSAVLNLSSDVHYIRFGFNVSGTSVEILPEDIPAYEPQVEFGTEITAYESPEHTSYSITFPAGAGTVYGGELTVNRDGTGTLVVDRANITYSDATGFSLHSSSRWYKNSVPNNLNQNKKAQSISNTAKYQDEQLIYEAYFSFGATGIYVNRLNSNETIEEFNARLQETPMVVCYPLYTTVTYTLTAPQVRTLLGINNIWADTGDIESAVYPCDTKLYIDKKLQV